MPGIHNKNSLVGRLLAAAALLLLAGCEVGSSTAPKAVVRGASPGNSGATSGSSAEVGSSLAVSVTIKDKSGYAIPGVVPSITAVDSSGSSSGITSGGCGSTNLNGVAGCTLTSTRAGAFTVKVASPIVATANAVTFYQVARSLTFSTQPTTSLTSGGVLTTANLPKVTVKDAVGTVVANAGTVTLTFNGNQVTQTANASGVADFTALGSVGTLSIPLTAGSYTMVASMASGISATSSTITVNAGTATKLVFTTQPSSTATVNANFAQMPVVQIADANNNAVHIQGCVITLALSSSASTDSLIGALSVTTDVNGAASFASSGLRISTSLTVGSTATFTVNAKSNTTSSCLGGVWGTTPSNNIIVSPSSQPYQLALTVAPGASPLNKVWTTQPVITVLDQSGNPVTSDGSTVVTIALALGNNANHTLAGSSTLTVSAGVATFTNLEVDGDTAATYTLTVTATNPNVSGGTLVGLTTSVAINANGLCSTPATGKLAYDVQPAAVTTTTGQPTNTIVVETQDSNGFFCFKDNSSQVYLAMISGPGHIKQRGTDYGGIGAAIPAVTVVNGQASFTNVSFTVPGTYQLRALSLSGPTKDSNAFSITSFGAYDHLTFSTPPVGGGGTGVAFPTQPKVSVRDFYGNLVSNFSGAVLISCSLPTSGCSMSGTTAVSVVNGVADFTAMGLFTNQVGGTTIAISASSSPAMPTGSTASSNFTQ